MHEMLGLDVFVSVMFHFPIYIYILQSFLYVSSFFTQCCFSLYFTRVERTLLVSNQKCFSISTFFYILYFMSPLAVWVPHKMLQPEYKSGLKVLYSSIVMIVSSKTGCFLNLHNRKSTYTFGS